jgi:hypothetical protein
MRAKTESPGKTSRPAAKQRKAQEKGVIALKGPAGLPRTGKRRAESAAEVALEPQAPAAPSASELKTMRLARIRERARAKPPVEALPEPQPPAETPIELEAPPVVVAEAPPPVVVAEAPSPVVVAEAPPVVVVEAPPPPVVVVEAPPPVVVEEAPPPVIVAEAPPVVVVEAPSPAVVEITSVERTLTPASHRQPWAPPRPRRPRTAAGLIVRAVSTLIRWGWGLRR